MGFSMGAELEYVGLSRQRLVEVNKELEQQNEYLLKRNERLGSEAEKATNESKRLRELNSKLFSSFESRSIALEAENAALKYRIGELDLIITAGKQENEKLKSRITHGTEESQNLKKKLEGTETRANNYINNLQRRMQDADAQLQRLRAQKGNDHGKIRDLQNKLNGTSWQASTRLEEKAALENANKVLEGHVQTLSNRNHNLHRRVQDLEAQLRTVRDASKRRRRRSRAADLEEQTQ
jgi:chromosome segregation ATPase